MSFAGNNIPNGAYFSSLHHYLPKIVNLSLEGNKLAMWRDLDYISGRRGRLEHLKELILMGNPIRELEYQNNRIDQYKRYDLCVTHLCSQYSTRDSEITRRFPTLEILDQEPVAKISFDAPPTSHASTTGFVQHPSATTFPAEMMPPFITGVDGSVISGFLMRYVV